jgi:hypothetical protein
VNTRTLSEIPENLNCMRVSNVRFLKEELNRYIEEFIEEFIEDELLNTRFLYSGILDVFNYCLSEEEAREIIIPYHYHQKHEDKFRKVFKSLFEMNNKCIVNLREPLVKLSSNKRNRLNKEEIKIYNVIKSMKNKFLIVENVNELDFFLRLSTQEVHFCDYIFDNEKVVINGNYDLSFPIYYQNPRYKQLIEINNLYVRSR